MTDKNVIDEQFYTNAIRVQNRIGNTPLLDLKNPLANNQEVKIYAKAEWVNPGGSVKDRPAFNMVFEGIKSGQLTSDKFLLDATSGNTGIAYAMLGAAIGFKVLLAVPENVSPERKHILKAYGADVIYTDPAMSSDGAIIKAKELYRKNPEKYFFPDQYNNDHNWKAHFNNTAKEIWEQTNGNVTHIIAGLGTSGTCMGTGRGLKKYNNQVQVVAVQPDSPFHGLEGMKRMDSSIVPGFYHKDFPDIHLEIQTEEAYNQVNYLAKKEGLLVGISAGAIFQGAIEIAKTIQEGSIVCVFPDSADKYLSENFWSTL